MANNKRMFTSNLKMADRRKQLERLYDGSEDSIRRIFDRASGRAIGTQYDESFLVNLLNTVGTETINREQIVDLSNFAYATEPAYATVIDYLANMFLWRYHFTPIQMRTTAKETDYSEVYELMTEVIDGMAIEVNFPLILTKLFKEGEVFLYTLRNRPSKTVSTILLNSEYCMPVSTTQYGTGIFRFDLSFFDDLGLRDEEFEEIADLFPPEIIEAYREYKNRTRENEYVILDGRYSTYLSLNDLGFPPSLTILKSLFDYDQYRKNEIQRSTAQLDTIISHKIPTYEDRILFEIDEVNALHKSMSRILGRNPRTKLMTTFGDLDVHPMQEPSRYSNEALRHGHDAIYRTAGLNLEMFNGKIKDALEISLNRDKASVWKYVQQLVNFYNLTINHLYSFRGYQAELTMLPITHYDQDEMMQLYRRNGEYGIGRIEAIVASGTKQKHILHKGRLEEYLKLDEILKPLASSHTQSGKDSEEKETEEVEIPEEEEVVDIEPEGDDTQISE